MSENNSSLVGWFLDDKKKSFFWSFITSWLIVNWEVVLYLIFDAKVAEAKILAIKSLMHIDGEFFAFLKFSKQSSFLLFYELILPIILTLIRMFIFNSLVLTVEWGVKKWESFIKSNDACKEYITVSMFLFIYYSRFILFKTIISLENLLLHTISDLFFVFFLLLFARIFKLRMMKMKKIQAPWMVIVFITGLFLCIFFILFKFLGSFFSKIQN